MPLTPPPFITPSKNGLLIKVRAKPNARTESIARLTLSDGTEILEVRINQPAEDGKANKAICEALAKILKIKKASLSVKTGTTSRQKIIEILTDAQDSPRLIGILSTCTKPESKKPS